MDRERSLEDDEFNSPVSELPEEEKENAPGSPQPLTSQDDPFFKFHVKIKLDSSGARSSITITTISNTSVIRWNLMTSNLCSQKLEWRWRAISSEFLVNGGCFVMARSLHLYLHLHSCEGYRCEQNTLSTLLSALWLKQGPPAEIWLLLSFLQIKPGVFSTAAEQAGITNSKMITPRDTVNIQSLLRLTDNKMWCWKCWSSRSSIRSTEKES